MQRISRDSLAMRAGIALKMRGRVKLRDWTDDTRLPNEQVIDHLVAIVLDEVFAGDALLVKPSPIMSSPSTAGGVHDSLQSIGGRWGVTEPWPDGER